MKRLEPVWLLLVVLAGLNWACIALFDTNVMSEIFGTGTLLDVVYVVVGFAALMLVPMLMAHFRMGDWHRAHPAA